MRQSEVFIAWESTEVALFLHLLDWHLLTWAPACTDSKHCLIIRKIRYVERANLVCLMSQSWIVIIVKQSKHVIDLAWTLAGRFYEIVSAVLPSKSDTALKTSSIWVQSFAVQFFHLNGWIFLILWYADNNISKPTIHNFQACDTGVPSETVCSPSYSCCDTACAVSLSRSELQVRS